MTKLLNGNSPDGIKEAVEILKNGGIVALPTETVYGLAADASNPKAIAKIFAAKNRPQNHPLILHVKNFGELEKYAMQISNSAEILAKNFWPGPLTMLFQKKPSVLEEITGGKNTVAIRIPSNKIFQEVLQLGNFALVAPSANIHKKLSPTKAEHVFSQMNGKIDAILDGGTCEVGLESTIVDARGDVKILRSGPILKTQIERILNKTVEDISSSNTNNVSGSMKVHYQPNKPVFLINAKDISNCINNTENFIFLGYSESFCKNIPQQWLIKMPSNALEYQAKLYNVLHEINSTMHSAIAIETPPNTEEWLAICDKLNRMVAE